MRDTCAMRSKVCLLFPTDHPPMFMRSRKLPPFKGPGSVSLPFFPTQAYGIGGLRKRPEAALLEDRDKPYVCDSECSILLGELQEVSGLRLGGGWFGACPTRLTAVMRPHIHPISLMRGCRGRKGKWAQAGQENAPVGPSGDGGHPWQPPKITLERGEACSFQEGREAGEHLGYQLGQPLRCLLSSFLGFSVCGKRYKNRPGLSYHYTHTHLAEEEGEEGPERHTLPFHRKNNHKRECRLPPPFVPGLCPASSPFSWGAGFLLGLKGGRVSQAAPRGPAAQLWGKGPQSAAPHLEWGSSQLQVLPEFPAGQGKPWSIHAALPSHG